MLMGIWRVTGSTRLHNLALTSFLVFNSTPSGRREKKGKKDYVGRKTLPTSIKGKEMHWLKRAVKSLVVTSLLENITEWA
eukprot:913369-Pelagomonas_calceolata.AAC.1